MTEHEVNRAAEAAVKQGLSDIAANDRRREGNIISLRVAPWIERGKVYVESAPGTVITQPMEDALIALAAAVLEADGQTAERDHDGAVGFTIVWKDSAWKPVGA